MRTLVSASLIGLLLTMLAGCATTANRNPSPAASAGRPGDTAPSPWVQYEQAP